MRNFVLLKFKTMHPADIILSKIYKGEPKDIRDATDLLDNNIVTLPELGTRFIEVFRNQKDLQ